MVLELPYTMAFESTSTRNTKIESYSLRFGDRSFEVTYFLNTLGGEDGGLQPLDDTVVLAESLRNKYETPLRGNHPVSPGVTTKGFAVKTEVIREVMRELSLGQNLVQISQWREIPEGLDILINGLPSHVKGLLRTEYSDSGVVPFDYGFPPKSDL